MTLSGHPLRQALVFFVWISMIAVIANFVIFRSVMGAWTQDGVQIGLYLLGLVPVLVWAPAVLGTLNAPRCQLLIGAVLVLAAIVYAAAEHEYPTLAGRVLALAATGLCEELFFRGFIWDRLRRAGLTPVVLVVVDDLAFTAWHLISVAAGSIDVGSLIGVAFFGVLFSLARLWSANTALPALIHWAIDISGHG